MKFLVVIFSCLLFTSVQAQFDPSSQETKKYYLITASTKDYATALKSAKSISEKMGLTLDLRDLDQHATAGLSWSESDCEGDGWGYPCYVARGRYDDGDFVSIEWSNAISGFSKGYYVVIISCKSSNDDAMKALLAKARKYIPSAYVKSAMVYMGCMH